MAQLTQRSALVRIFIEFLTQYPKQFSLLFFILILEGCVAALSILSLVPLADFILDPTLKNPSRVTQTISVIFARLELGSNFYTFGALFVLTNLIKALIEVGTRYAILKIKYSIVRGLFGNALSIFFKARWEFFSGDDHGRLLNTLTKELSTIGDTLGHLATALAQVLQLFIYLAIPMWLDTKMTVTAIGLAIFFAVPFLLLHRLSYSLGKRNTETGNAAMTILSESLAAARLILGYGRQKQTQERYLNAFDAHVKVTLLSQILTASVTKLFQPLAMLAVIMATGFAVVRHVNLSEMAAVMWSLLAAMPILSSLLHSNISISNFLPSYEQLESLRNRAKKYEETQGPNVFSELHKGIQLKNVSFAYPGRSQTLNRVNIDIAKGQMTALVGESGSGKSTIADLILGLQVPDEGNILIDDQPLTIFNLNSFRSRIGYVPQDPQLFNASIRLNLLWSYKDATESDLNLALTLANAEQFVAELPNGMDTVVGDRGVRLSGGQRQRIALARALIRKPDLLILDEATSALDSESEQFIQIAIDRIAASTTILVIAHRLSTIANAQQVYVIKKGVVIEQGSFSELSTKTGSVLNNMLDAQTSA